MLRGKTGASAALVCMAMLAVGGCTQTSGGTPSLGNSTPATASGTSSTATSAVNGAGKAPPVTNPLDVSKFMTNPCLSITSTQAADLTIEPQGKRVTTDSVQGCAWPYGPNRAYDITVGYIVPDAKNGLQNLYDLNAAGQYNGGYFEPTTIDGYPGAYNSILEDRAKGRCQLSVGLNNQTLLFMLLRGPDNTDLCKGVAKAATAVVETIKRG